MRVLTSKKLEALFVQVRLKALKYVNIGVFVA